MGRIIELKENRLHAVEMKQRKSAAIKSYGYKWMNDGIKNLRIPQIDHQKFLDLGWNFGRLTKHDSKGRYIKM